MTYQSKKDPTITAALDFEDEKCATTRLIYLTGEKKGYSFVVSNSTLKRWWRKVNDEQPATEKESVLDFSKEEIEQINTPYKPEVTPHYIPKPQSVIEYEEKKKRNHTDLPTFEDIVDKFGPILKKVNEKSNYVRFNDGTTLHRKTGDIRLYTVENIWVALTEKGMESKPNNDKDRPFAFIIKTMEDFDTMSEVLINTLNTK